MEKYVYRGRVYSFDPNKILYNSNANRKRDEMMQEVREIAFETHGDDVYRTHKEMNDIYREIISQARHRSMVRLSLRNKYPV